MAEKPKRASEYESEQVELVRATPDATPRYDKSANMTSSKRHHPANDGRAYDR